MACSVRFCCLIVAIFIIAANLQVVAAKPIVDNQQQPQQAQQNEPETSEPGDGAMDATLLNYLYAREAIRRLGLSRDNDVIDQQRKRNHWKQCAFNAVSCFGRRRRRSSPI